jgi:hypothetical protein
MRTIGTVIVACLVLYVADLTFADGRYFQAVVAIARHLAGQLGFDF